MTDAVLALLEAAQARGFLGPGPVHDHVEHALQLANVLPDSGLVVDLGSGGGLPGLPLIAARPGLQWVLVEANQRRARWLRQAVRALDADATVREERAELTGRSELRGRAAAVMARSFGPPAVTAECGAPLLGPGAMLWVAEPPAASPDRWPGEGLALLGLERRMAHGSWQGLSAATPCPDRYPRHVGIPAKRPLF
jgi:16S rRNA (guanine527-N7)-methyltransferase